MTSTPRRQLTPRASTLALVEDADWMATTGETLPGAAARLHIHPGSLRKTLHAAGRDDIIHRLFVNADPGYYSRGTIRHSATNLPSAA